MALINLYTLRSFDSTRTNFDNLVAREYINGSLVNPLGQIYNSANPATSSDSRLFAIDQNVTLGRYAASQDAFFADCDTVFSRLLNDGASWTFSSVSILTDAALPCLRQPSPPQSPCPLLCSPGP